MNIQDFQQMSYFELQEFLQNVVPQIETLKKYKYDSLLKEVKVENVYSKTNPKQISYMKVLVGNKEFVMYRRNDYSIRKTKLNLSTPKCLRLYEVINGKKSKELFLECSDDYKYMKICLIEILNNK